VDRRALAVHTALAGLGAAIAVGGLFWAVFAAARGQLTLGDVSIFIAALGAVSSSLAMIIGNAALAHQGLLMFRAYLEVVAEGPDLAQHSAPVPSLRSGIELASVTLTLAAAAVLIVTRGSGAITLAEFALGLACGLTAVLATGVAAVVRRGVAAPCACFGTSAGRPLTAVHLARNLSLLIVLLAGVAAAAVAAGKATGKPALAGSVIALATGLVAALAFIRWDDLAYLFGGSLAGPDRFGR
jgi:hypothetical protein